MDGITLAEKMEPGLPLVLLSSLGYHENQPGGSRFSACLNKPVKPSQLHDCLIRVVTRRVSSTPRPATKQVFNREIGSQHPLHLLVVEDNEINQKLVVSILGRLGYKAELANNGLEALEILRENSFDVVLMDIQMPEMDGETATLHIRRDFPPAQQPRVIAMTANALSGDREHYLSVGMDDYLSKPIKVEQLVRALRESQPLGAPTSTTLAAESSVTKAPTAPVQQVDCTLDLSYLREFSEVMGEGGIEMAKELVLMYRKNTLSLIAEVQRTLDGQDFTSLHRVAHTLKGNSSQVGAIRLSSLCFNLEQIAKKGSADGVQTQLEQIKAEFGKVESELEKVLQLSERTWYAFNGKIT
jgi:CheY-like chemotaxis protein